MEKTKLNCNQIFRNSGIILLFFITNVLIITSLLFFVGVSITAFHAPIAFIITIIETIIVYRKKSGVKEITISILISILIIVLSIILVGNTYDLSWDGNTYHKTAVGSLKNGWNPVYEKVEDFTTDKGNKIDVDVEENNKIWINHYPKASWIFAATIYSITNNIESAKIINIVMMYICFSLIYTYMNKKIHNIWATIVSLLIVINPITVTQIFNYYIDGLLGLCLFIILSSLIAITSIKNKKEDENNIERKFELKENFIILANIIVIIINLKFTGLVYAAIFCFLFYIYWLYKANELKEIFVKYTGFYIVVVIISVLIVGYSSYIKNIFDKGHPFYPLFGENKIDIITYNQPYNFKNKNVIKKFVIAMFAEGSNIHDSYGNSKEKPNLKIPFTIQENEIQVYAQPDIRMSRIWSII